MAMLFDLSDEIQLIDRAPDDWNVEPEQIFYALRACGMLSAIIPVFEGEKLRRGASSRLTGSSASMNSRFAMGSDAWSQALDDKDDDPIDHFFVGQADNPQSWQGVIRHVFQE